MVADTVLGVHELPKGGMKAGFHGKLEESRNSRKELPITQLASPIKLWAEGVDFISVSPPNICWAGHIRGAHS